MRHSTSRRSEKKVTSKYDTGRFGRGCLLARRLVESGARFVEVTTEYVPFLHWDTHADGHATVARMHAEIDRPIAQLILDLESQKLLDRTLVIIASEFSRDAIIEGKPGSNANDQATHKVDVCHRNEALRATPAFHGRNQRGDVRGRDASWFPVRQDGR